MDETTKQPLEAPKVDEGNTDDYVKLSKDEYASLKDADTKRRWQSTENQRLSAVAEVVRDNSKFFKIYATDKSKAEFVASQRWYANAKEMNDYLETYYKDHPEEKKQLSEDDLYEKFEVKQQEKEAKKALNSFLKEKGIEKTSKLGKSFMEEIEDYMEWKRWTEEMIEKASNKIYALVKWTPQFVEDLAKTRASVIWAWGMWASARKWWVSEGESTSAWQNYKQNHVWSIQDFVKTKLNK